MKTLLLLLFTTAALLGQGGSYCSYMTGDPRLYANKFGLVAYYGLFDTNSITLNGAGESKVIDKSWQAGRLENLLVQSETFATTWTRSGINAFGATDTGASGAGSFANTARTTDPLGGNTADFIQEDNSAAATHRIYQTVSLPTAKFVVTVNCKPVGRAARFDFYSAGGSLYGVYDLTNSVVLASGQVGTAVIESATATSIGNGWVACSVTGTVQAGSYTLYVTCHTGTDFVYNGDNTSGLFLWGAQLRRSTSSSTYYATTTVVEDASRDLLQGTAANQPLVSRSDNKGNQLIQSETFSTSWIRTRLNAFGVDDSGTAGAGSFANTSRTLDPLSGNTADFVQEDATAANSHFIRQLTSSFTMVPSTDYTYSIYLKAAGRNWAYVWMSDKSDTDRGAYFDLTNGVVGTIVGTATASISSAGNEWYRCSVTKNSGTGAFAGSVFLACSSGDAGVTYDGDNTSGLFLWGASLRQSTWDSDYIATTSTIAVPGLNGKTTAYFDGTQHYLKTAAFTLNQPTTCIWVGKQVTWTMFDRFFDGNGHNSGSVVQEAASPNFDIFAGANGPTNTLPLGQYGIVSATINGASSTLQVNNGTIITGNPGANNMGGFTLGASGIAANPGNIQVSQVLLFNRALLTNEVTAIQRWAQGIGGTALAF